MPTFFQKNYKNIILGLFILFHAVLFNINVAEWGDSYRILRASNYIQRLSYPIDEKRPPLFSAFLAIRLPMVDPIVWGRGVMLVISIASFLVFSKILDLIFKDTYKTKALALLMFAFNPVYFYWSLRIYADVPLSLLALLCFYIMLRWKNYFIVGLVTGLAVLTRFEGYILFLSIGLGLAYLSRNDIKKGFVHLTTFTSGVACFVIPFLIWRNPLTSTYFEEPARRVYNLETLYIFFLSLLFIFGFVPVFGFLNKRFFVLPKKQIVISVFVVLELILVLLWPAAVPRLFVPAIPFLILFLSPLIVEYYETMESSSINKSLVFIALFAVYIVGQHFLRLQFLSPHRIGFVVIVLLQIPVLYAVFRKQFNLFLLFISISMLSWSFLTVWLHKDVYTSLVTAAEYSQVTVKGKVAYNDVSAVSDWHLNNRGQLGLSGYFIDVNDKTTLLEKNLVSAGTQYLLLTNEHNPDLNIDIKKRPYLSLIKEFSYTHGGRVFWTKLVKVN